MLDENDFQFRRFPDEGSEAGPERIRTTPRRAGAAARAGLRSRTHETTPPLRTLADLAPGASAVVQSIDDGGAIGRRLLDLGLLPGTPVCVVRRAPLGDPAVYELRGYQLCLRRSESTRVRVDQVVV